MEKRIVRLRANWKLSAGNEQKEIIIPDSYRDKNKM